MKITQIEEIGDTKKTRIIEVDDGMFSDPEHFIKLLEYLGFDINIPEIRIVGDNKYESNINNLQST